MLPTLSRRLLQRGVDCRSWRLRLLSRHLFHPNWFSIGAHDVAGDPAVFAPINFDGPDSTQGQPHEHWEYQTHALLGLLATQGLMTTDEMRRAVENLPKEIYLSWGYYEKWATAMASILIERKAITTQEFQVSIGAEPKSNSAAPLFSKGDVVRVLPEAKFLKCGMTNPTRWRKPHLRTPGYIFGAIGRVDRYCGTFCDPEFLAFQSIFPSPSTTQPLYTVTFLQRALWTFPEMTDKSQRLNDTVNVDIYQSWLAPATESQLSVPQERPCVPHSNHEWDDTHNCPDHQHLSREETETEAVRKEGSERPGQRIAEGLIRVALCKDIVSSIQLQTAVSALEQVGTNHEGPRIIARAWTDSEFKTRLLEDANAALEELGLEGSNSNAPTKLVVVENVLPSAKNMGVHNLVVCTLCSCYPVSILGLSPSWYKSRSFRARAVYEPREVLAEFGLTLPDTTRIKVYDSTADLRYMVLPAQPEGTSSWGEKDLQALVTRDSMIGVSEALQPCTSVGN